MTAYVVSGLGQAKAAGYTIDDRTADQWARMACTPRWPRILT